MRSSVTVATAWWVKDPLTLEATIRFFVNERTAKATSKSANQNLNRDHCAIIGNEGVTTTE
jgi:hypothetical protein